MNTLLDNSSCYLTCNNNFFIRKWNNVALLWLKVKHPSVNYDPGSSSVCFSVSHVGNI